MPPTNVVLEVDYSKTQEATDPFQFVLDVEVTRSERISPYIFMYQRDLSGDDTFCTVASPTEITTYQSSSPKAGHNFYRAKTLQLKFDTLTDLNEVLASLEIDIQKLVDDYKILLDENLLVDPSFTRTYTGD